MRQKSSLLLSSAVVVAAFMSHAVTTSAPSPPDAGVRAIEIKPGKITHVMRAQGNRSATGPTAHRSDSDNETVFSESFPSYEAFEQWTILDKNNDLTCWDWTDDYGIPFAYCYGTMSDDYEMLSADDWIISPDIALTAGHAYRIVATVGMCGYTEEKVEVFLGKGKSADVMTMPAIESTVVTEEMAYGADIESPPVTIHDTGDYNVGIHMTSLPASHGLALYGVTVYDLGEQDPGGFVAQRIYLEQFESKSAYDAYVTRNLNGDSGQWSYNTSKKCARYTYNSSNQADDWLITPDLALQVGRDYKLVFKTETSSEPERIEVRAGKSQLVEDLTTTIVAPTDLPKRSAKTIEATFKLSADEPFHLAFHAISDPDKHFLDLDDIEIWDLGPNGDEPVVPPVPPAPEGLEIPYDADMRDPAVFATYTIVDGNDDGRTWLYDIIFNSTLYNFSKTEAADDWLISPWLKLEKEKAYKLSVEIKSRGMEYPEQFEAWVGTGKTPGDFTIEAIPSTTVVMDSGEPSVIYSSGRIQVEETGIYTVAIHATSPANMSDLEVYRIKVDEVFLDAPEAVSSLSAEADPTGQLKATISFTAPSKNIGGGDIQGNLSKIEIFRGDKLIETLQEVAPGSAQSVTDTDPEIVNGINQYTVTPFVGDHDGPVAQVNLFVGTDIPLRVTGLRGEDLGEQVRLTWEEVPNVGQNGGLVYPAGVKYNIYAAFPEFFMGQVINIEYELLATVTGAGEATIDYEELNRGDHETIYFGVKSETAAGEAPALHTTMLKGKPLGLPYEESFTGEQIHDYTSYDTDLTDADSGLYFQEICSDDDGASLCFIGFQNGGKYMAIFTGKLDLTEAVEPTLSFDALNTRGHNTLVVQSILPDGTVTELARFIPDDVEFDNRTIILPDNVKDSRWTRLTFAVEYPGYVDEVDGNRLNLDNIRLYDAYQSGIGREDATICAPQLFPADIYAPDGRLLRRAATSADGLEGIVIIQGRKMVVKRQSSHTPKI